MPEVDFLQLSSPKAGAVLGAFPESAGVWKSELLGLLKTFSVWNTIANRNQLNDLYTLDSLSALSTASPNFALSQIIFLGPVETPVSPAAWLNEASRGSNMQVISKDNNGDEVSWRHTNGTVLRIPASTLANPLPFPTQNFVTSTSASPTVTTMTRPGPIRPILMSTISTSTSFEAPIISASNATSDNMLQSSNAPTTESTADNNVNIMPQADDNQTVLIVCVIAAAVVLFGVLMFALLVLKRRKAKRREFDAHDPSIVQSDANSKGSVDVTAVANVTPISTDEPSPGLEPRGIYDKVPDRQAVSYSEMNMHEQQYDALELRESNYARGNVENFHEAGLAKNFPKKQSLYAHGDIDDIFQSGESE